MTRAKNIPEIILASLLAVLVVILASELGAPRAALSSSASAQLPALHASAPTLLPLYHDGDAAPVEEQPRAATTPRGTIGSAIESGNATWYDDGPGYYAAVHSWHWGDKPYRLLVRHGHRRVLVTVRDQCPACGPFSIDLSPAAFRQLAPLSVGRIRVTIEWPQIPLPPTDTAP